MNAVALDEKTIQELQEIGVRKGTTVQAVTEEAIHHFLVEQKREIYG